MDKSTNISHLEAPGGQQITEAVTKSKSAGAPWGARVRWAWEILLGGELPTNRK